MGLETEIESDVWTVNWEEVVIVEEWIEKSEYKWHDKLSITKVPVN